MRCPGFDSQILLTFLFNNIELKVLNNFVYELGISLFVD